MSYQPFLIAPFATGLDTDQATWMLPADAFTEIENGHIHHGWIEKRAGYRLLGTMVHGTNLITATNANPAVFTVTTIGTLQNGDTVTLAYLAGGDWPNLNGASYTVANLAGASFTLIDEAGVAVSGAALGAYTGDSGQVGVIPNLRIMGIIRFIGSDNTRQLLISDTERIARYNVASEIFEPLSVTNSLGTEFEEADVWASAATDYVWQTTWQNPELQPRVYMTNGKAFTGNLPAPAVGTDGICFYDGQNDTITQIQPQLSVAGAGRWLFGCKLMFAMRGRLIALHTFEFNGANTTTFPQRLRWCQTQGPANWIDDTPGAGGFVDASTAEQIVSGYQLQDLIIIYFTNSVWMIRNTGDPQFPFQWERINSFRACDAKMGSIGYDRYVLAVGQRGITATDGVETKRVDDRIDEFVINEINSEQFSKVFGARDFENRRTWLLYPQTESADCDAALIYDEDSSAYSTYLFARTVNNVVVDLNVLGYGENARDLAAQDFTAANDLDKAANEMGEETALSFFASRNTELFLGGDRNGQVHILDTETSDNETQIPFSIIGSGWNPYKDKGIEAQFGYIDLYCDSDQVTELSVKFFKDDNDDPYIEETLDLLPDLNFVSLVLGVQLTNAGDPTLGLTINAPNSGLVTGDVVYLYGVNGMEQVNDQPLTVTVLTPNFFSVLVNATGYGTYTFGGQVVRRKFYRSKVWKRVYAGGIGYLHSIQIESSGVKAPLRIHAFKPWFRPRGRRAIG